MKKAIPIARCLLPVLMALFMISAAGTAQKLPPLPDRQMEKTTFGYRINGRFSFLWYPSQPKFREEFTINPKTYEAYRSYLRVTYPSKALQWAAVGCIGSLFFVQHTELSAGLVIGAGSVASILTVPLTAEKNIRLERAIKLRNTAWYHKVRE